MIDYAIVIDAPASVVYGMLTEPDRLVEWMAREATSDARPHGEFRWVYENGDVVAGRYLELEPPHRLVLAYGWEVPAARGIPPGSTRVEITLDETDGGTLLRLVHEGLPTTEIASLRGGWDHFLVRLARRCAGSRPSDRGEPDA